MTFKWYIVSPDIAQVVERWRGKREIAGSNPNKTFFNNSFVLFVYFHIKLYILYKIYIKINL